MYIHKSLKLAILALLLAALVIFSGCGGPAPPINHPPTIIILTADPQSPIGVNQSTVINCLASDPDGDALTYSWTKTGGTISGSGSAIIWTAPNTAGIYTITCTVSDGKGGEDSEVVNISVSGINHPPVISSLTADPQSPIGVNQSTVINCLASDPDGDALTYSWTKTGGTISGSGSAIIWTAPNTAGIYTITCTVSDGKGGEDSEVVNISVSGINHPPVISSLTADPSSIDINQSSTITCIAYDPDGDALTYNWTKTGETITGSGSTITWTAPATAGTYAITCTVSDGNGGEDSEWVNIIVNELGSVPSVSAVAVTYHLYRGKEQSIINKLVKEDKIPRSNSIIKSEKVDKSGITYAIDVEWAKFNGASGYKVYRSVNWTAFKLVYTEEVSSDYEWYGFWDDDTQMGNIYSYYVIAYGPFGETVPDKIVSIDTWLPPCSLISPLDMTTITNPNPTFTWSPVGISAFPYGTIYSAESDLWVYDETDEENNWCILFDNLLTNIVTYNQDGEAIPLVYGHNYIWNSWGYGYDQNGNLIAISASEDWEFYFGEYEPPSNNPPTITSTANTSAIVGEAYTYDVDATDPDGDVLTYSLTAGPSGMTIDAATGIITWTPATAGSYDVTVVVSDGEFTDTQNFTITVILLSEGIVYRAFLIGVGDYIYGGDDDDLPGPPYDVDRMIQIFNQCRFGPLNTEFSTINYLKDWQATKSNILQGIASTFFAADNNDISYFHYGGHGMRHENTSYLCPADVTSYSLDSYISVNELENALSAIPGTKVVFLDTCHSGGFIGKGKGEITISKEELKSFNNEIINVFSQAQSKGLLTTNQYKVLTACLSFQVSAEIQLEGDPFGVFTMALCEGCGYFNYSYPADTNLDTKVSLQEAYLYVKSYVQDLSNTYPYLNIDQDVQVYPDNSTFTIVEY